MFAECFDLGPQYKMVSDHSWILGSLSPKEERHMLIKGKCCVSLRVEWSQDALGQAIVAVRFEEVSGFAEQSNTCCIFLPPQQPPIQLAGMQS